jgi:DNA polymerase-3 subunit gamma/tau
MSDYIVTARKWRPMKFDDVVGQQHVVATLRNALAAGRLAHAYLFAGPRGVGKTTTARLLAKAVNCLHPMDFNPDNDCALCREINEGRSFDVLEIDGASNRGVEEIRNLRDSVRYTPTSGKYKVYIIDEVHMLTKEAFNALLKTLEEPPPHILFIFATTEIHKLPATILSRCQRFDFRRIAVEEIVANLAGIAREENLHVDEDALMLIARKGDGSLRDAQSFFDQVIALCGTTVTHAQIVDALNIVDTEVFFRVTELIVARNVPAGLDLVDELMRQGHDIKEFLAGLTEHCRNLIVAASTGTTGLIEASDMYRKRYAAAAAAFTVADLLRMQRLITETEGTLRYSAQPRFTLEAAMVQLITMHRAPEIATLLEEIDALKKKLIETPAPQGGGPAIPPARRPAPPPVPPPVPTQHAVDHPVLAEGELTSRWQEFVGEVRRTRISLGSVLASGVLLGVKDGVIRIGCVDDFQVTHMTRNKDLLQKIASTLFHIPLRLEAVKSAAAGAGPDMTGIPSSDGPPKDDSGAVLEAMRRELGAEPIE